MGQISTYVDNNNALNRLKNVRYEKNAFVENFCLHNGLKTY